jgi:hypothetical protein
MQPGALHESLTSICPDSANSELEWGVEKVCAHPTDSQQITIPCLGVQHGHGRAFVSLHLPLHSMCPIPSCSFSTSMDLAVGSLHLLVRCITVR